MAKMGRPLVHTPQEVEERAAEYFATCEANETPLTITGLALALGMTSRRQLIEYSEREEFHNTIKDAKLRCEQFAEARLFGNSPTGAIFALKNYGWSDRNETVLSGPDGGPIEIKGIDIGFVATDKG